MERWTAGVSQWFRQKLHFLSQNLFPLLKLISNELLKLSYLILELLTDLVTPILDFAGEIRRVLG